MLDAISEAMVASFADEDEDSRPVMVTKAVVLAEGVASDGSRRFLSFSGDMPTWELIGFLESHLATVKARWVRDD